MFTQTNVNTQGQTEVYLEFVQFSKFGVTFETFKNLRLKPFLCATAYSLEMHCNNTNTHTLYSLQNYMKIKISIYIYIGTYIYKYRQTFENKQFLFLYNVLTMSMYKHI